MRVEWVHPSWRDLVIEHLGEDSDARARFLSGCGAHGALLALSLGGGERGERSLPLLARDADWDALTDRIYELLPELGVMELSALLDSIAHAIATLGSPAAQLETPALARMVLERQAALWNDAAAPIPLRGLESWLGLASRLPAGSWRPAPPELGRTWAGLLPAAAPSLDDREAVERFADWLTLADLLREHSPGDLHRCRFRDHRPNMWQFLDTVESARGDVDPAVRDHVHRALDRIEALDPEFGHLASYFRGRLAVARMELPREPGPSPAPLPGERPGWRLFDVARVLDDL
jgi:hypothetical protein